MRLASALVLVLGIAVFADSALAGNGNGNGNGNGKGNAPAAAANPGGQDSSPGNSANAPGQAKKDAALAASEAPAPVSGAESSSTAPSGVKPSSDTEHETHAAASSNQTKQYGNGRTAGEIAIQNGAPRSTRLHGPGNSQPHKVSPCSGGHEIDVHALKGRGHQKACGTTPSKPPTPVPPGKPETNPSSDPPARGSDPARPSGNTPQPNHPAPKPVKPRSGVEAMSGALAGTQSFGRGSLPFTGVPLWIVAMVAVALIVVGLALRRRASQ